VCVCVCMWPFAYPCLLSWQIQCVEMDAASHSVVRRYHYYEACDLPRLIDPSKGFWTFEVTSSRCVLSPSHTDDHRIIPLLAATHTHAHTHTHTHTHTCAHTNTHHTHLHQGIMALLLVVSLWGLSLRRRKVQMLQNQRLARLVNS